MVKKITFSIALFVLSFSCASAQLNNDAGLWSTFSIQHEIKKKYTLTIDQEFRLRENYLRMNLLYTNIGIAYKSKNWKVESSYRFINKFELDGSISFRHRLMLDLIYKKKFGNFSISERARYQAEVKNVYSSERAFLPEQYLRMRTMLDYSINGIYNVYYSCELRYQIDVPTNEVIFNNNWHRIRNAFGVDRKLNKKNSVGVYYLVQDEFNISSPKNIYITGIQYNLKL